MSWVWVFLPRDATTSSEYETLRELHGAVWAEAFLSDVQQWASTASEHTPLLPPPSDPTSAEAHHQLQELTNKMSALEQQLEVTLTGLSMWRRTQSGTCGSRPTYGL